MKKIVLFSFLFSLVASVLVGQAYPDRHNTSYTDAWVSCVEKDSPNFKRDPGHWIMYDFGDQYSLHGSTLWNFNVPDTTARGVRDIIVDYSTDGETWIEVGEFSMPEAPGSAFYEGDEGPDFDGIVAKYVLISILNTHGDANCAAMSEFRINATVATSTNIPDKELDINIVANPNPASEFTIVNIGEGFEDLNYSLLDMSGRLLRQGTISGSEFRLNTSTLVGGTYTFLVNNSEGQKSILINVIND